MVRVAAVSLAGFPLPSFRERSPERRRSMIGET